MTPARRNDNATTGSAWDEPPWAFFPDLGGLAVGGSVIFLTTELAGVDAAVAFHSPGNEQIADFLDHPRVAAHHDVGIRGVDVEFRQLF